MDADAITFTIIVVVASPLITATAIGAILTTVASIVVPTPAAAPASSIIVGHVSPAVASHHVAFPAAAATSIALPVVAAARIVGIFTVIGATTVTVTTTIVPDTIVTAARLMSTSSPPLFHLPWGWPSPRCRPVLPAASACGRPIVEVVASGVVASPTSGGGGGNGGVQDDRAAATTTSASTVIHRSALRLPTTMILPRDSSAIPVLPIDASNARRDGDGDVSSLLPGARPDISGISNSTSGRGHKSGRPLRACQFRDRSPPPSTVTTVGAAWRLRGCPTALAVPLAWQAPPRSAPADLLTSSCHPQPGCRRQLGVRAGPAPRVTVEKDGEAIHVLEAADGGGAVGGIEGAAGEGDPEPHDRLDDAAGASGGRGAGSVRGPPTDGATVVTTSSRRRPRGSPGPTS